MLFFGVTEWNFTFHHYLEHLVKDQADFPLYEDQPYDVKVIDHQGRVRWLKTYVFSKQAIQQRRVGILFGELTRRHQMTRARIGNTPLVSLLASETVDCTFHLARRGIFFYELS